MKNFFQLGLIISALPVTLTNGTTANATDVMSDLNHIVNQVNANAAELADVAQLAAANSFTAVQSGIAATSGSNFPIASQVQNASFQTLSSVAGDNTITARVSGMTLTGYARGQLFSFVPAQGNSGSATINIDGQGAVTLYKEGNRVLGSDDLQTNRVHLIRYRNPVESLGTGFDVLNPGLSIAGRAFSSTGDMLVGSPGSQYSTLSVGSNLNFLVASTGSPRRMEWGHVGQFPLASSISSAGDMVLVRSANLGLNAGVPADIVVSRTSGAAQAWVKFNSAGTVAASLNVASITDNGTGDWTVNFAEPFATANYCGMAFGGQNSTPDALVYNISSAATAAAFRIQSRTPNLTPTTALDPDQPDEIYAVFFGAR